MYKPCSFENLTYGIYQISTELDTFIHDDKTDKNVYDYPELHGHLQTLKKLGKDYYNSESMFIVK